jgi:hypothetical protein
VVGHPLLIFPTPREVAKSRRFGGGGKVHVPGHARQTERLGPRFERLQQAFDARRARIQSLPEGTVPEMVLVIELAEAVGAFKATLERAGLEWLDELDVDDLPPDEDFYAEDKKGQAKDEGLKGRVFLTMSDQRALQELASLWRRWSGEPDAAWPRDQSMWRRVFERIREVRPWSSDDRIRDTGLMADWQASVEEGNLRVRFEAELWFRREQVHRTRAQQSVGALVARLGGRVIRSAVIPEIHYHGLLGELPIAAVREVLNHPDVDLLQADDVMFFRPTGQTAVPVPPQDAERKGVEDRELPTVETVPPVVALLDGMPVESHRLLADRVMVEDPDGWAAQCPAAQRYHGTAMASLLIHGDLGSPSSPLGRPIYARPVLKPHQWHAQAAEAIPDDQLAVDMIHRAVRRLFDGEGDLGPVAPTVRVVNLSIGEANRPFISMLSPWAKLLDWLAARYQVLFVVSAGNHPHPINLGVPRGTVSKLDKAELEQRVLQSLVRDSRHRRLLSPAESINALTVGALHTDESGAEPRAAYHVDPYQARTLPSPVSAHGLGYRRAIKPDVLLPGGRQFYQEPPAHADPDAVLEALRHYSAPGQRAAAPGSTGLENDRTLYYRGTSNSAALATRLAAELYEVIETLRRETGGDQLDPAFDAVLLKAMLVHGAAWGDAGRAFDDLLRPIVGGRRVREQVSRFLGYGAVAPNRAATCTEQRATLLGCARLAKDEAHEYVLPLPPSLSGQAVARRLTITLAWLSPVAPGTQKYRRAHLWYAPVDHQSLVPDRLEYSHTAATRGTVQHEIFVGEKATVFADDDALRIRVNCREDAPPLEDSVPYGLAVSLEVAEGIALPIYEEVRSRIRPRVAIRPGV